MKRASPFSAPSSPSPYGWITLKRKWLMIDRAVPAPTHPFFVWGHLFPELTHATRMYLDWSTRISLAMTCKEELATTITRRREDTPTPITTSHTSFFPRDPWYIALDDDNIALFKWMFTCHIGFRPSSSTRPELAFVLTKVCQHRDDPDLVGWIMDEYSVTRASLINRFKHILVNTSATHTLTMALKAMRECKIKALPDMTQEFIRLAILSDNPSILIWLASLSEPIDDPDVDGEETCAHSWSTIRPISIDDFVVPSLFLAPPPQPPPTIRTCSRILHAILYDPACEPFCRMLCTCVPAISWIRQIRDQVTTPEQVDLILNRLDALHFRQLTQSTSDALANHALCCAWLRVQRQVLANPTVAQ